MVMASGGTGVEIHPVVYAGRFADSLSEVDLPDNCTVLDDWEVLPLQLAPVLEEATTLVVLDIFSFPFDAISGEQWEVPLVPILPEGFDPDFLEAAFGVPLFERLGFPDRLVVRDDGLWDRLRARYGWSGSQRIEAEGGLEEVAAGVLARLEEESSVPTFFGDEGYEALPYWKERGAELAASVPHRAVCSVHHGPRFNKAMHRAQAAVLEPQFLAARGERDEESGPFKVLEVGAGVGRWARSFDLSRTRFTGVDISEGMVEAARANFPEGRFDHLGDDMVFPYEDESFDLVFSVTVLHHNPAPAKRALISEMWRVARPGGRLLFLEDFVAGGRTERSTVYPMSVTKFVDLLLEATNGQVLLEHVESLRYPHDAVVRGGVLAVSKLGVPKQW